MHDITVVDTGFQRPGFDASFLIVDDGRAAFVDTGTNQSVPRLMAALAQAGLAAEDVQWVILTHVHLDHAGGAGLLMNQLPQAQLVVHARGARHMADPGQLLAGVRAVYGDAVVARDYGELVPVPADRIVSPEDGAVLRVGTRELHFLDTPGHARHHHCIWDPASQGVFSGDTLGISYKVFEGTRMRFGLPSTTPVQFDPVALRASLARIRALEPKWAYLTHFGALSGVDEQIRQVLELVDRMTDIASACPEPALLRRRLMELYVEHARHCGVDLPADALAMWLEMDVELNAQGLEVWRGRA